MDSSTEQGRSQIRQFAEMNDDCLKDLVHTAPIIGWLVRAGVSCPAAITTRGLVENRFASDHTPSVIVSYDKRGGEYFVQWLIKGRDAAKRKVANYKD